MKTPRSPDLALLMPGLICSALTVAFILFSMPGFDDVFGSLRGNLPLATQLLIRFKWGLPLLPTLVLVIGLWGPCRNWRGLAALIVGLTGSGLLLGALYAPIFSIPIVVD